MGVILLGDKTAAAHWLSYAKSRAAALAKQGNNLSQTFSPAEGVTIRVQTLQGTPRVWIEAGGDLVFTAGFEDGVLHLNMARDYDRVFRTRLTIPPEPGMGQGPNVYGFQNLGEGMGFFVEGAHGGAEIGYVVKNLGAVTAKPIALLDSGMAGQRRITYIGKYDGQKRLISMPNVDDDPNTPFQVRVNIFDTDSAVIATGPLPLEFPGFTDVDASQVYFLGQRTIVAIVKVWNGYETLFFMIRSTDGGFNWDVNSPDGLSLVMDQYAVAEPHWDTVRMTALPNGKALAVGVGDPTFGGNFGPLVSFLSHDRGASFNTINTITAAYENHPHHDPVAIGGEGVVLNGVDASSNTFLFRSMNSGGTWEALPPIAPGVATRNTTGNVVLFRPGVLGVAVSQDSAIRLYLSHDNGETWTPGQRVATGPLTGFFNTVLRIGNASRPLPANPAIPDLYENPS